MGAIKNGKGYACVRAGFYGNIAVNVKSLNENLLIFLKNNKAISIPLLKSLVVRDLLKALMIGKY